MGKQQQKRASAQRPRPKAARRAQTRPGPASAASKAAPRSKLLTRRALALALGVHMMTITKWEQDGMPRQQRGARGRPSLYSEADVRAWREQRDAAARSGSIVDVAQERARKERAQAQLAEQAFAKRQGDLLPKDEVAKLWAAEQQAVRAKLLAIPTAWADRVQRAGVLDGLIGVEAALREAINDALRELAVEDREPHPTDPAPGEAAAA